MHLKTLNKWIVDKYPWLELVKGNGYFYFIIKNETVAKTYPEEARQFGLCEHTSIYVQKISTLTKYAWHDCVDTFVASLNIPKKVKVETFEYVIKFYEKDGRIHTRYFTAINDDDAIEALKRHTNVSDIHLYKRIK